MPQYTFHTYQITADFLKFENLVDKGDLVGMEGFFVLDDMMTSHVCHVFIWFLGVNG